jgi:hypothetical protein
LASTFLNSDLRRRRSDNKTNRLRASFLLALAFLALSSGRLVSSGCSRRYVSFSSVGASYFLSSGILRRGCIRVVGGNNSSGGGLGGSRGCDSRFSSRNGIGSRTSQPCKLDGRR